MSDVVKGGGGDLSVREAIFELITSEDREPILDARKRALDVIVVQKVVNYLDDVDPILAQFLVEFQALGRRLNSFIMQRMEDDLNG